MTSLEKGLAVLCLPFSGLGRFNKPNKHPDEPDHDE